MELYRCTGVMERLTVNMSEYIKANEYMRQILFLEKSKETVLIKSYMISVA